MSQAIYRRRAILSRIHKALDAFYLLQKIDWEYDVRSTLEKILGLALGEIEFEEGKHIERGLIIVGAEEEGDLEVHAGWRADDADLTFSRTVVQQTISTGAPILCENAKHDPRFMAAESIKDLETLSLISVPIHSEEQCFGALYIESKSPKNLFNEPDLDFLQEFSQAISPYVKTALTHQWHIRAIQRLQEQVSGRYSFSKIVGRSHAMQGVFDMVKIAAEVDRPVLLTGESGCGKELIAHAIHYNGPRKTRPFVVVDCSSLSEHLLESELFGHRRGAFTGASADKIGAFQEADGGTIFLDEISDASKQLQQKLRRVLQEGEIRRVGDNEFRKVNVRVICATNRSLQTLVEGGEFMKDLYFRINRFPIKIPPLRERKEDIPLLVSHFLQQAVNEFGTTPKRIRSDALALIVERDWEENNVRELRNTMELCIDFCRDEDITPSIVHRVFRIQGGEPELQPHSLSTPQPNDVPCPSLDLIGIDRIGLRRILEASEDAGNTDKHATPYYRVQLESSAMAIIEGLRSRNWKLRPAARLLGVSPTKLRGDLKEYTELVLKRFGGDMDRAAVALDVPPEVLRRKISDLGIEEPNGEEEP